MNDICEGEYKMIKVDIISGFLGAGKTTLIKRLFQSSLKDEKVVLIENEFGEIGIDGSFLKESGVEIKEINSGCICCSLVGDFASSMKEIVEKFNPERIIIEPSGVGKLSDIVKALDKVDADLKVNILATVVDGGKTKMYHKNFGEFYNDQVEQANTVIISKTEKLSEDKILSAVELVKELNPNATVITTPVTELDSEQLLNTLERNASLAEELIAEINKKHAGEHEHHHHDHDDDCDCGCHEHHHHDHDDDDDDEHEHHHHHDDDDDDEHEHGHHHHHHDHEGGEVEEYGIGTFVYYRREPFNMARFDEFVARKMPKNVIRVKGICYFKNEYDNCYIFEQAGKQVSLRDAGLWFATMPANELAMMMDREPTLRRDWDDTYGDRMQKLVFIGQHLDKDALVKELDACLTR